MITLLFPTIKTEIKREKQAKGKWRLWDGVAWKGDYPTKKQAKRIALQCGGEYIGYCGEEKYEVVKVG